MLMSWVYFIMVTGAFVAAIWTGQGPALGAALGDGAQAGIRLTLSMAGSLCLWTGLSKLMERIGISAWLARLFGPLLNRLFPSCRQDRLLAGAVSGNFCANLLGLGNAATPLGIEAAKRLAKTETASNELCRLVVLNTASIQLIPTTVAAVRSSLGSGHPYDILPAVWVTSLASAGLGLTAAWLLGKVWRHD